MIATNIEYNQVVQAFGRNGNMMQIGIEMTHFIDRIVIAPVNSRGDVGRCSMEIPLIDVEKIAQALIELSKKRP